METEAGPAPAGEPGAAGCSLNAAIVAGTLPTGTGSANPIRSGALSNGPRPAGQDPAGDLPGCAGVTFVPQPAQYRGDSPAGIPQFGQNRIACSPGSLKPAPDVAIVVRVRPIPEHSATSC